MDAISLLNQGLAGRYLVEREIGAGGMATVFLARDLRHDRHVALKVLEPELAAVLGAERFLSEIRVTAKLQHTNLLPLFDSGESGGLLYYVMPYVEGETLRHRLDREKQLPVDEALRLAIAICGALDYAHRHGVIHRDLKPENVLLHDGQPVIADFGIALAISNAGGARLTQTGLSLGTPQYMSPEQATGDRTIDARADIYSVGAVLYEMLAGEAPHTGPTSQAVIGKLLTEIPQAVSSLRRSVPSHVDAALHHALAKVPADRFATAHDFAEALSGKSPVVGQREYTHSRSLNAWALAAAGVAAIAIAVSVWIATREPPSAPTLRARFTLVLPDDAALDASTFTRSFDLSPDGTQFVYVGANGLFIRPMNELVSRRLTSEPSADPHFSPDGAWVGYTSGGKLRKVQVSGGAPRTIVDSVARFGWSSKGTIVFSRSGPVIAELWRVSDSGGTPTRFVQQRRPIDIAYGDPAFLPDGDTFLVPVARRGGSELAAGRLSDGTIRDLDQPGEHPVYFSDGVVLFVSTDESVQAVQFDAKSLRLVGSPKRVLAGVMRKVSSAELAASSTGTIAYLPGAVPRKLVEIDRTGRQREFRQPADLFATPRYSPSGQQVAVVVGQPGPSDVWIYGVSSDVRTPLTSNHRAGAPEWTRDGKRVGWTQTEAATGMRATDLADWGTFWRAADGGDSATPFVTRGLGMVFAPTGDFAVGVIVESGRGVLYAVPLDSNRPRTRIHTAGYSDPPAARVSPDGAWVAYMSSETGRSEVYLRPIGGAGGPYAISADGGREPMWNPSGGELFYRTGARLVAATLTFAPHPRVVKLDTLPFTLTRSSMGVWAGYDVSRDGQRILTVKADAADSPIVVTGWLDEVRERLKNPK